MKFCKLKFGSKFQEIPSWTKFVAKDGVGYWWAFREKPRYAQNPWTDSGYWTSHRWNSAHQLDPKSIKRYPICQYEDGHDSKESIYEVY